MSNTYKVNRACCKPGHKFVVGGCMDEEKGRDYETTEKKKNNYTIWTWTQPSDTLMIPTDIPKGLCKWMKA